MAHVPYRVTGQLVTDLVSGQLQVSFQLIPNVLGQIRAGQLRPLALTAPVRSASLPDVPTTRELGIGNYEAYGWFALLGPRGLPRNVLERLHGAYTVAANEPAVRSRIVDVGAEPASSSPEELRRFMDTEARKWGEIIRVNNIKPE
jgi:tripartite-type tricarboxylate transporter receptor subunit TctC